MNASEQESKNWLEWLVFAVGLVLVLGAIGSLLYEIWNATPRTPAVLEAKLGEPEKRADLFVVPVTVTNRGDETAEDVHIEVVLEKSDGQTETAEFQLAFVPKRAERIGAVTFTTDPATAVKLEARPMGFAQP